MIFIFNFSVLASSYVCSNCNGNTECENFCARVKNMTAPPMLTQVVRTKPSWWYPLPCKDCFGYLSFRNKTLRKFCSWGCGKRITAQPLTTSTSTTSEPISTTIKSVKKRNGQLQYPRTCINIHINYIWLLIGVVGVGFITTVLLVTRKYALNKRKVGTVLSNPTDVVVRIGEPFVVS